MDNAPDSYSGEMSLVPRSSGPNHPPQIPKYIVMAFRNVLGSPSNGRSPLWLPASEHDQHLIVSTTNEEPLLLDFLMMSDNTLTYFNPQSFIQESDGTNNSYLATMSRILNPTDSNNTRNSTILMLEDGQVVDDPFDNDRVEESKGEESPSEPDHSQQISENRVRAIALNWLQVLCKNQESRNPSPHSQKLCFMLFFSLAPTVEITAILYPNPQLFINNLKWSGPSEFKQGMKALFKLPSAHSYTATPDINEEESEEEEKHYSNEVMPWENDHTQYEVPESLKQAFAPMQKNMGRDTIVENTNLFPNRMITMCTEEIISRLQNKTHTNKTGLPIFGSTSNNQNPQYGLANQKKNGGRTDPLQQTLR